LLTNQITKDALKELVSLNYSYNQRGLITSKYDKYIGADDGLKESYSYDNLDRLIEVQVDSSLLSSDEHLLNYSYDKLGNLTAKNNLNINYKDTNPHQIANLNGVTYEYDKDGNLIKDDRHNFTYNQQNKVTSITQNGKTVNFRYGSKSNRYIKLFNDNWSYTHYIGKLYEKTKLNFTQEDAIEKNYIYFKDRLIAIKQRAVGLTPKKEKTEFTHHDNLTNIIAITDEDNNIIDRRSYKPFGEIRAIAYKEAIDKIKDNLITQEEYLNLTLKQTNRSFTSHEYINDTDIIHMNGRVYDTITSRFTSADPYIQESENLQNYNRYSYVMNNPVNLMDPSGYFHFFRFIENGVSHLRDHGGKQIVALAAAVAVTVATGGAAIAAWGGFFGSVATGALAGAASGAIMTGTLEGTAKGALWGGITAGVAYGVAEGVGAMTGADAHGASFFNGVNKASVTKAIAHGLSRAAIAKARYGTGKGAFLSGFVSSGFSVGAGEGYKGAFAMAIVGGTVSEIGGGKFANGAWGSAFQYLFNQRRVEFPDLLGRNKNIFIMSSSLIN
jgi:RHS repeat-associated protein